MMQIIEPLEMCYRSLCKIGDNPIVNGNLLDFIPQISCFGFCQESERHADIMDAITLHLGMGSYKDWSQEER